MIGRNNDSTPHPPSRRSYSGDSHIKPSDLELKATQVFSVDQLPAYICLGDRDDTSFERNAEGWSCLYRFEGEPFMQLGWNGMMWEISRFWKDWKMGTTAAPAKMTLNQAIALHAQYISYEAASDPYERLFKERLEATAAIHYWLPQKSESIVYFVPSGLYKGVVFPISSSAHSVLRTRSNEIKDRFEAILVLTERERQFQLVTRAMPEELAERISSELSSTYGSPTTKPSIAHKDTDGGRIWRIQLKQEVGLAYIFLPMRGLFRLVEALRAWQLLPPQQPESASTAQLIMHGALVVGAAELLGQTSVYRYHRWLIDMPTAIATFPPLPKEAWEDVVRSNTTS